VFDLEISIYIHTNTIFFIYIYIYIYIYMYIYIYTYITHISCIDVGNPRLASELDTCCYSCSICTMIGGHATIEV
jgi:hypothetical protein